MKKNSENERINSIGKKEQHGHRIEENTPKYIIDKEKGERTAKLGFSSFK